MSADSTLLWQILVVGLLLGLGIGFVVAYLLVLRNRRADSLREELAAQKARMDEYRRDVDAHFVKTSELFQDFTERYRAIHDHLATGARRLCSDDLLAQRLSVVESRLLVEQRPEEAQADRGARDEAPAMGVESGPAPAATRAEPAPAAPAPAGPIKPGAAEGAPAEGTAPREAAGDRKPVAPTQPHAAEPAKGGPTGPAPEAAPKEREPLAGAPGKPTLH